MRFTLFKAVKPKPFIYTPRFYDPDKEAAEKRKAALGLDNTLSESEKLRLRMEQRWRRNKNQPSDHPFRSISLLIYIGVIGFDVYFNFFTDFIDKLLRAFGVGN